VMRFGVECGVRQHPIPTQAQRGQQENGRELRGIVGRSRGDGGPGDEVGVRVGRDREFGPTACGELALGTGDEVPGSVPAIEAGRIDGDGGSFGDQFGRDRGRDGTFEEVDEDPPFSSRPSA
jgi:hypothetical protein